MFHIVIINSIAAHKRHIYGCVSSYNYYYCYL
jgi:hypothetical protein